MLDVETSKDYRQDVRRMAKRRHDISRLIEIQKKLQNGEPLLGKSYRNHKLSGDMAGYKDCHIGGDWILIYDIDEVQNVLYLVRTGTHADLFKK